METLTPLSVDSLAAVATERLRIAIVSGVLKPGTPLVQRDLAAQLGVSRQPIRDAIKRLQHEGIIVEIPRKGTFVRSFSEAEIRENYILREALESVAARYCAAKIEPQELAVLKSLNDRIGLESTSAAEVLDLNTKFHKIIRTVPGLPALEQLVDSLWAGLTVAGPLWIPDRTRHSVVEHDRIINGLAAHDETAAEAAMRTHIREAGEACFTALARRGKTDETGSSVQPAG